MNERITTTMPTAIGWYRVAGHVAHFGQPGEVALCTRTRKIPLKAERIADIDWQYKCWRCTKKQAVTQKEQ